MTTSEIQPKKPPDDFLTFHINHTAVRHANPWRNNSGMSGYLWSNEWVICARFLSCLAVYGDMIVV